MMRSPLLATVITIAAAASQLGATDCGEIIEDPGFDLWCGDKLCSWDLDRGEIAPAGSWHADDDAVALLGADTAISQMTPVNSWDTSCIRFEMLANVAESTEVRLEADLYGDGSVEWSERIPTSNWDLVSFAIRVEGDFDGIRFHLTKNGDGTAVLARIAAFTATDCPSSGVAATPRANGRGCQVDADCASNYCWSDAICSDCGTDADCGDGEVCGHSGPVAPGLLQHQLCFPAGSRALAEPCLDNDECASGVCNETACSECTPGSTCGDGSSCGVTSSLGVALCGPGSGERATGDDCFTGDDCASGSCDGTSIGFCADAIIETWCTGDEHCPGGSCTFLGVAGGTCR